MITPDQLKEVQRRTESLSHYLDIESKKIEVEEEELRTHVADFWDDRTKAEAQMRKIKELHFWIDSYTALEKQVEELELAFDFVKEGLVTEEEVDAQYASLIQSVEKLELRNMLRREEDKLGVVLKIIREPAELRARTGRRCLCASICVGQRDMATRLP